MTEQFTAPKGTYDVLPEQQPLRRWAIGTAEAVFTRYGYRRIDTPTFEDTRLFARGVGSSSDIVRKEMYTFEDLGGRSMTLRPEGTAPVARAYVEHGMHTLPQPVKLYYHCPMFRYEAPQSGRYRQHYQLGVEAFGSESPELDGEVIGMLAEVYRRLGLTGIDLRLNSMGCRECRPGYAAALRAYLDTVSSSLCGECVERARLNPLRTFDCKVSGCRQALEDAPRLFDHLCPGCAEHHARVKAALAVQDIDFIEDHTLVRGMDYYTRTTFEFQSSQLGAQSGIGGGGRYDNLVAEIGGPETPGVGFGTGVERILLAMSRSNIEGPPAPTPFVYLVAVGGDMRAGVFSLAHQLRSRGIAVDLDYQGRSPKGQMKQAGRTGARYAIIIGEAEAGVGAVTLRDLALGEERKLPHAEAVALVEAASVGAEVSQQTDTIEED
jgi:histidyl-tRNA synthetase